MVHIHALQEKAFIINLLNFFLSQSVDALVSLRLDLLLFTYFSTFLTMYRKLWIFYIYKCSLTWQLIFEECVCSIQKT